MMPSASMEWARLIEEIKDIPEIFKHCLSQILGEAAALPYLIYAPQDTWRKRVIYDKLLFIHNKQAYILENVDGRIVTVCHPFEHIINIEHGKILLYSWIRIESVIDNNIISSIVEYNTVLEPLFKEILGTIRDAIANTKVNFIDTHDSFYSIKDLTCRLENYTSTSLLPNQKVMGAMFQPALYKSSWFISKQILIPNQLIILTHEEFIIYKEEFEKADIRKFGGVWLYLPVNKIREIECTPDTSANLVDLSIRLNGSKRITLTYPLKRSDDVRALISHMHAQMRT